MKQKNNVNEILNKDTLWNKVKWYLVIIISIFLLILCLLLTCLILLICIYRKPVLPGNFQSS